MKLGDKLARRLAGFAMAGLAALTLAVGVDEASAQSGRDAKRGGQPRAVSKPVMAIVSLSDQRVKIYDADGKILEAPVSTGATGYETPAGIFSIVQKKEIHQSNLYEDGQMPFMQRITWTGIALHAGVLPGRPASHGCIRLPSAFAQRLFEMTDMGMRVLIVRDEMAPSDIAHAALFRSRPVGKGLVLAPPRGDRSSVREASSVARIAVSSADTEIAPGSARHLEILKSIAAAKAAEAEAAVKREREARPVAAKKAAEAAPAVRLLRAAEADHTRAEALLQDAERLLETATSPESIEQAETAKTKALARIAETQAQLQTAKLQAQARLDAAERASEEAKAAAATRNSAADAADDAARKTLPVSVFISRKAQRLYVRKANHPVFEGPVTIRDPDKPIGTFVYTALKHLDTSGEMRWSVVSMYKTPTSVEPPLQDQRRRVSARSADAFPTDVATAKAALDRITIPQEAIDRISEVVLPGSSLIISDEPASRETGKDTDFVVVMSGEPQGALKVRRREPTLPFGSDGYPFKRSPYRNSPFFFWN